MSQPHKKNKKIQRIPRIAKRRHSEPLENSRKKPRIEIISISDSDDSIAARTKNKRYAPRQRYNPCEKTPKPKKSTEGVENDKFVYVGTFTFPNLQKPLYSICFNYLDDEYNNYFAVAGGNCIFVCTLQEPERGKYAGIRVEKLFIDCDEKEEFYIVKWGYDVDGTPILAAGGQSGVIKIFNFSKNQKDFKMMRLLGHGGDIHSLNFHPTYPEFLLSGSGDHSVRLWDLTTGRTVAIFGGDAGHRNSVLSVDFHNSGVYFVSGGMDNAVKVWEIPKEVFEFANKFRENPKLAIKVPHIQYPIFTTQELHFNYVDCVKYYGDLILSKSSKAHIESGDHVYLWGMDHEIYEDKDKKQPISRYQNRFTIVRTLHTAVCDIWYSRFALDPSNKQLAVPMSEGGVQIFDMTDFVANKPIQTLKNKKLTAVIRDVAFSRDGRTLLFVGDDASIWRYDLKLK